jgi:hypothetical protein
MSFAFYKRQSSLLKQSKNQLIFRKLKYCFWFLDYIWYLSKPVFHFAAHLHTMYIYFANQIRRAKIESKKK